MGRLTQMITYLNSDSQDWTKQPVKISVFDFTHYDITSEAKLVRKGIKYGSGKYRKLKE